MKIAVIGAGAIGSIVAAHLAKAGCQVLLIGRADQVSAIEKNGLRIKKHDGQEIVKVRAATQLDQEYDLVIFTVKTQDLESAFQDNHRFLENCWVLTTQNGVMADNLLSCHFDPVKMMNSIVMFGATYTTPGEVTFNFPGDWIIGKPFTPLDQKVWEIAELFKPAFSIVVTPQIIGMKWLKLFVNFNNCIPALIGKSMQETFADMDFCRLSILLLKEGVSIVRDAGIELVSLPQFPAERILGLSAMPIDQAAGIMHKTLTALSKEPLYGSILQSILRKKTSEIDFINGEVVHLARSIHRTAPLNAKMVDMVHQVEQQKKFWKPEEVKKAFELNALPLSEKVKVN